VTGTGMVRGTGVAKEASPPAAALRSMSLSNTVTQRVGGGHGDDWEALADDSGQGGGGGCGGGGGEEEEGDWEALAD
jgi:hypothetical protein